MIKLASGEERTIILTIFAESKLELKAYNLTVKGNFSGLETLASIDVNVMAETEITSEPKVGPMSWVWFVFIRDRLRYFRRLFSKKAHKKPVTFYQENIPLYENQERIQRKQGRFTFESLNNKALTDHQWVCIGCGVISPGSGSVDTRR